MAKQRIKDMQMQLQKEAEMTTRQAALIRQLYAERDDLVHQTEALNRENKLLRAQCAEWQKVALGLMIKLTNIRADLVVQSKGPG